jgi:hypothetical protein
MSKLHAMVGPAAVLKNVHCSIGRRLERDQCGWFRAGVLLVWVRENTQSHEVGGGFRISE